MQIAINENGERIFPFKDGRGKCQLCGGLLIAHCGEVLQPHWHHFGQRNEDCDTWKEPETAWHRAWKERFPAEWREVVIGNHRADVKTPYDLVLEFQNSPISPAVIREREEFYGLMFWIINAADFDENLIFVSKVKQNLKRHEEETLEDAREALREIDRQISAAESLRNKWQKDIYPIQSEVHSMKREIEGLEKNVSESRQVAHNVVAYSRIGLSMPSSWNDPSPMIAGTVDKNLCLEISTRIDKQREIEGKILQEKTSLKTINEYPNFIHEGVTYKVVPYKSLTSQNYHMVSPVLKSSMTQLFAVVKQFVSEADFLMYRYKQTDFAFIVNLSRRTKELENTLTNLQTEHKTVSSEVEAYLDLLEHQVLEWLRSRIVLKNSELEKLKVKLEEIENGYQRRKLRVEQLIEEKPMLRDAIYEEMENNREEGKGKIMQRDKGRYILTNWKHKRKSWQDAEAILHFDTGRGYLFAQITPSEFRKMTIEEFVSEIMHFPKYLYRGTVEW